MTTKTNKRPWWRRLLKFVLLTLLAVILFVAGILVATVSILTPERLTPIVERLASSSLQNARFEAGSVELRLRSTMPYLHVDVVDARIISTAARQLDEATRLSIGTEADTVVSFSRLSAGLNLAALPLNRLQLSDVILDTPMMNLVVLNDSLTNFDIIRPSEETEPSEPMDWKSLPSIRIKRIAVENARPLRYRDIQTGTDVRANLHKVSLDGSDAPAYMVALAGDVQSEMFSRYVMLQQVRFSLDGTLEWSQQRPMCLGVKGLAWGVGPVTGTLDTQVEADNGLKLNTFDCTMGPVSLTKVLDILPDSLKEAYDIPLDLTTTATVQLSLRLDKPFAVASSGIPRCTVRMLLPDSKLAWGKVRFETVGADVEAVIPSDDINSITVRLHRIALSGPATAITLSGTVSSLMDDPMFDGEVHGTCDLTKLPPILLRYIPGGITGRIDANAAVKGRPSMLSLGHFHRLKVLGDVTLHNFRWIAADTLDMVYTDRARLTFGTNVNKKTTEGASVDSLLNVTFAVDSVNIMHSDISMYATDIHFEMSAVNRGNKTRMVRNREIMPMGGGISIGKFNLMVLTDTAVVRLRKVSGLAVVKPHGDDMRTPEFLFDLNLQHLSAGDKTTRLLLRDINTRVTAFKQPQGRRAQRLAVVADSIHRVHPELSADSVYEYALREHNSHRRRLPRVHPDYQPDSTEIIYWDTATGFKRLLTQWRFSGELRSSRGAMFTRMFPVRNRFRNVNVTFNNDTVLMRDIEYKAGHSDFTLSGRVTNLRRAFTSANYRQPLRINLDLRSDTVDINQLAATAFAGSAYMQSSDEQKSAMALGNDDSETSLEREIGAHVANAPDSMAPLLIPKNIDATLQLSARNIIYSDFLLHDLTGKLLAYNGALNLHDLSASSDVGGIDLSALYMGRDANDLSFGFGLRVNDFNIHRFLHLVPAVDSLMPLLRDFSGIISADIAATSRITPSMDIDIPTLDAAIKLSGDSLVLIDPDTFKSLSKWLMFKDKKKNIIKHMSVQMLVKDNTMKMFPFIFDIDRYHLGVQGTNDFALNFDYHIAVLKSPIPFKFGINIKGNPDKYKIRLGGAKFDDKTPVNVAIVDTTRVNLIRNIEDVFRRGVDDARFARLRVNRNISAADINLNEDTLTHLDSLRFIQEGLIPAPEQPAEPAEGKKRRSTKGGKGAGQTSAVGATGGALLLPMLAVLPRRRKNQCKND